MSAPRSGSRPGGKKHRRQTPPAAADGVAVRRLAVDALSRIDEDAAYANLVTNSVLDRLPAGAGSLDDRDRHFVTELVYGTTRRQRSVDHLIDRHRRGDVSARVRAALRVGAYQLAFGGVAPHAAVSATVGAAPKPARGLVNAVLRRVAEDVAAGIEWPDDGTRLSYPDWIVAALRERLGDDADAALEVMNDPATTHVRADGYVQDEASQQVIGLVDPQPGDRILDACAAPGGKATALASLGAQVVAADHTANRAGLIAANRARLGAGLASSGGGLHVVVADALRPCFEPESFDRILLDAPCSGLGVLRRRPDARWRIDAAAPGRLAALQVEMMRALTPLVRPGGLMVFSVCTLTTAENAGVVTAVAEAVPALHFVDETTIVPDATRDGMFVARWRRTE